jgi:hypothetical protein
MIRRKQSQTVDNEYPMLSIPKNNAWSQPPPFVYTLKFQKKKLYTIIARDKLLAGLE